MTATTAALLFEAGFGLQNASNGPLQRG